MLEFVHEREFDLNKFNGIIFSNMIQAMQTILLLEANTYETEFENNTSKDHIQTLLVQVPQICVTTVSPELVNAVQTLWNEPAIKRLYERNRRTLDSATRYVTPVVSNT